MQSLDRAGLPGDLLGDLAAAAVDYASLWGEIQPRSTSTESVRGQIVGRLLAKRGIDDQPTAQQLSDAYAVIREETGVRAFDGVSELLRDLRQRYALGLLTNGPSDMQWPKLRALGFTRSFDTIVVAGDVGIYKPDRQVFELLIGRLGIPAASTLFVGDSYEMDIVGACGAGMRTAWVQKNGAARPIGVAPDLEIDTAVALRELLL